MSLNPNIFAIAGKKETQSLTEILNHTPAESLVKRKEEIIVLTLALIYVIVESASLANMRALLSSAIVEKLKEQ